MVIDAHAHLIVPEITRDAAPEEAWRPQVAFEDGRQVIDYGGRKIRSAVRPFADPAAALAAQAEAGVQGTLFCPWVSLLRYDDEPEATRRACQIQNEALTRLAQDNPDRVRALGTVPLQAPEQAARDLETWMKQEGFVGVVAGATVRGQFLGEDRFEPFWAAAEETGALVFVHPVTRGFGLPSFEAYYLWNAAGNPMETAATAAHMVMAGVMERHPGLKVLLSHGGGALLALRGRLRHAHSFQPQARARLRESPADSIRRFYFDTITHDADLLRALIDFAGSDHVLLGSDYPFDMGLERPVEAVRALGLAPEAEARILGGNAARLVGWEVA